MLYFVDKTFQQYNIVRRYCFHMTHYYSFVVSKGNNSKVNVKIDPGFNVVLHFNVNGTYLRIFQRPNGPFTIDFLEKEVACLDHSMWATSIRVMPGSRPLLYEQECNGNFLPTVFRGDLWRAHNQVSNINIIKSLTCCQ